jgi:hypothetical protein
MLAELPSYTQIFQELLGDLYDNLSDRVRRLRLLVALDDDFGGRGIFVPGGHTTYNAYVEARSSFVGGNFIATVLLCQALTENLLAAHLHIDGISRGIHEGRFVSDNHLPSKITLKDTVRRCRENGLLSEKDEADIWRLTELRNPLSHYRHHDDPQRLDRRAMDQRVHELDILEEDARFAIATVIGILGKPEFAMSRRQTMGDE